MKNWQKYAAEVYGTFVLVGIGTGTILAAGGDLVAIAFGFGLALVVALCTVGRVSGGHFNPAVTLGMFLDQRISLPDAIRYWVSQIAGAVLAGLVLMWVLGQAAVEATVTQYNAAALSGFGAFVGEALLTMTFVMVILVLAKSTTVSNFLIMGFALAAVHLVGLPITGASVNPARSLGPAIVGGEFSDIWIYLVGPAVGAILAWVLFKCIVEGKTDLRDDIRNLG